MSNRTAFDIDRVTVKTSDAAGYALSGLKGKSILLLNGNSVAAGGVLRLYREKSRIGGETKGFPIGPQQVMSIKNCPIEDLVLIAETADVDLNLIVAQTEDLTIR